MILTAQFVIDNFLCFFISIIEIICFELAPLRIDGVDIFLWLWPWNVSIVLSPYRQFRNKSNPISIGIFCHPKKSFAGSEIGAHCRYFVFLFSLSRRRVQKTCRSFTRVKGSRLSGAKFLPLTQHNKGAF